MGDDLVSNLTRHLHFIVSTWLAEHPGRTPPAPIELARQEIDNLRQSVPCTACRATGKVKNYIYVEQEPHEPIIGGLRQCQECWGTGINLDALDRLYQPHLGNPGGYDVQPLPTPRRVSRLRFMRNLWPWHHDVR